MIIQKDKLFKLDLLSPQDLVTLHRRQQHVGQTETRCFDLSGHGVTLPARLSFTYSSFIELLYNVIRWFAGRIGQMTRWQSVWCSKYHFIFIKSCKNPFNLFFLYYKNFECPKSIRRIFLKILSLWLAFTSGLKSREGYDGGHIVV